MRKQKNEKDGNEWEWEWEIENRTMLFQITKPLPIRLYDEYRQMIRDKWHIQNNAIYL